MIIRTFIINYRTQIKQKAINVTCKKINLNDEDDEEKFLCSRFLLLLRTMDFFFS